MRKDFLMSVATLTALSTRVSDRDANEVSEALRRNPYALGTEQFEEDTYLDGIIEKPWGCEYRVYADSFYDIWKLSIEAGHSTSMHCHPRKETSLLCLRGTGKVQFLSASYVIQDLDFIHIGKGVFHSTTNIGSSDLDLIEVETPRNKLDLLRLTDRYGRAFTSYERKVLDVDCPLLPGNLILGSKYRPHCIQRDYHFELQTGANLSASAFRFLVSLSTQDAIEQSIQVHSQKNAQQERINLQKMYFVISQGS
jgi:mannose-6-phosphate isomerase-like protein (cupin superfamily)